MLGQNQSLMEAELFHNQFRITRWWQFCRGTRSAICSIRQSCRVEFFGVPAPEAHSLDLNGSADDLATTDDDLQTINDTTTTTAMTADHYTSQAAGVGSQLFLPWWKEQRDQNDDQHFRVRTAMKSRTGEGLPVDPGSPDNLVGSAWSRRMADLSASAGIPAPKHNLMFLKLVG